MKKVLTVLLALIVLAVMLCGLAVFAGHAITEGKTNIRYVYVGDINVSGLTREETEQLLIERGWKDREEKPLTVTTLRGVSFEVDPVRAGIVTMTDSAVRSAYAVGHDRDMITNLITAAKAFVHPVNVGDGAGPDLDYLDALIDACQTQIDSTLGEGEYTVDTQTAQLRIVKGRDQLQLDREGLRDAIIAAAEEGRSELSYTAITGQPSAPDFEAIHKELEREPADAYYSDDGKFTVTDEIVGCKFDTAQALSLWNAAEPGDDVLVPLDITWPAVTGEQLRSRLYHDLLGACMTKFPNSGENRRSNLNLCASKINEHVLYPGDVFSYNETVGQRTEEAGFLPAPAYVNGDVKDEIGGGACQISSTLYASTLFAFLETVDRTCHVFPVNYMQPGTDATVTIPAEGKSIDFKFRNNKNYPIMIKTFFDNEASTITIEIWGTLEEEDYMPVEFDNTYSWTFDYDRLIAPAYPDRTGYTVKLQTEFMGGFEDEFSSGYRCLTHRLVIDPDNNVVEDTIVNGKLSNGNYALDTYYEHP
ncbi:MAG: VanW family protein [Oscillospiraceae bacterium]|nr:VanW family protein [Oscillospiraceae bacterium]